MRRMKERMVAYDNIATKSAPVYRKRYVLPLTPAAVRAEQVISGEMHPTPLDILLTDEEANALEQYVRNEEVLDGNVKIVDYCGDRSHGTGGCTPPIPDEMVPVLSRHIRAQRRLCVHAPEMFTILALFCAQQRRLESAESDAQLGLRWALRKKNKAAGWRELVVRAIRVFINGN